MTLKGPYADDYPSRETALAIVEAMSNPDYRWQDVERVTGADTYTAERCFLIHGLPALEPTALSRWIAERFMMPSKTVNRARLPNEINSATTADQSYGFTPRR